MKVSSLKQYDFFIYNGAVFQKADAEQSFLDPKTGKIFTKRFGKGKYVFQCRNPLDSGIESHLVIKINPNTNVEKWPSEHNPFVTRTIKQVNQLK